jgi:hypothetical protein
MENTKKPTVNPRTVNSSLFFISPVIIHPSSYTLSNLYIVQRCPVRIPDDMIFR